MTNPFEDVANEASRTQQKRFERNTRTPRQPMKLSPVLQKQHDQAKQLKRFREWKREIRAGLLTGEYAPEITQLLRTLRRLPDPETLVDIVRRSKWLTDGHLVMRAAVFEYMDHAITRWRVRHGLSPFDDGLPGEPATPFVLLRQMLMKEGV